MDIQWRPEAGLMASLSLETLGESHRYTARVGPVLLTVEWDTRQSNWRGNAWTPWKSAVRAPSSQECKAVLIQAVEAEVARLSADLQVLRASMEQ